MITLYRVADCALCDEVQQALRELVVAHQTVDVTLERPATLDEILGERPLPVVVDGEQVISGETALRDYLAALTREMEQWRKFQVDACYIDDQGKTC
jgi:glutaredoxin